MNHSNDNQEGVFLLHFIAEDDAFEAPSGYDGAFYTKHIMNKGFTKGTVSDPWYFNLVSGYNYAIRADDLESVLLMANECPRAILFRASVLNDIKIDDAPRVVSFDKASEERYLFESHELIEVEDRFEQISGIHYKPQEVERLLDLFDGCDLGTLYDRLFEKDKKYA